VAPLARVAQAELLPSSGASECTAARNFDGLRVHSVCAASSDLIETFVQAFEHARWQPRLPRSATPKSTLRASVRAREIATKDVAAKSRKIVSEVRHASED
jgi:hypothetical protein